MRFYSSARCVKHMANQKENIVAWLKEYKNYFVHLPSSKNPEC